MKPAVAVVVLSLFMMGACGGSSVQLSSGGPPDDDDVGEDAVAVLSTETFEAGESVQSSDSSSDNEDVAVNAPLLSAVTDEIAFLDCSTHEAEGDPAADYVALTCDVGVHTVTYAYYCTATTDEDDNEIFTISRDTDDDPVVTDELFPSILVTCEKNDGEPELFEEEFIAS